MKKNIVALALALVFIMAIAAPAFAQTIVHVENYNVDGTIWMNKQVGHYCNTGAEQKQTIRGEGSLKKSMDSRMVKGKLTVVDKNDFVTAPDAVANLTIVSVIRLCTPPKYTYTLSLPLVEWFDDVDYVVHPATIYNPFDGYTIDDDWDAVSDQIWAAYVSANPGFSGNLHQDYVAAYGPFWADGDVFGFDADWFMANEALSFLASAWALVFDLDVDWPVTVNVNMDDHWRWEYDEDDYVFASRGKKYVGDYFNMNQMVRTSDGEVKRYIDISSPWSHGYLFEDFESRGFVEIEESFNMLNIPEGVAVRVKWWQDLF